MVASIFSGAATDEDGVELSTAEDQEIDLKTRITANLVFVIFSLIVSLIAAYCFTKKMKGFSSLLALFGFLNPYIYMVLLIFNDEQNPLVQDIFKGCSFMLANMFFVIMNFSQLAFFDWVVDLVLLMLLVSLQYSKSQIGISPTETVALIFFGVINITVFYFFRR
jgi:hypothetical protein